MEKTAVVKIGFWSAVLVIAFTSVFAISILPFIGRSFLNISFLSSFFLAIAFAVMMTSVLHTVPDDRRIWAHIGQVFAIIYAALNTSVYYIQLVVVSTGSLKLPEDFVRPLTFSPGTPVFAIDMLGYGFLTLSTLFAAFSFSGGKTEIWIKRLFILHGIFVIPTLLFPAFASYEPPSKAAQDITGNLALLGWSVIFLPGIIVVASLFKEKLRVINNSK